MLEVRKSSARFLCLGSRSFQKVVQLPIDAISAPFALLDS